MSVPFTSHSWLRSCGSRGKEQARLIEGYAGNPLALKIVAETIAELFRGRSARSSPRTRWSLAASPTARRASRPPLDPGANGALVAGYYARTGDPRGAERRTGDATAECVGAGSGGRAASAQPGRARTTPRQLHVALGGAGVHDRGADRGGGQRDRTGTALAPQRHAHTDTTTS